MVALLDSHGHKLQCHIDQSSKTVYRKNELTREYFVESVMTFVSTTERRFVLSDNKFLDFYNRKLYRKCVWEAKSLYNPVSCNWLF